MNHIGKGALIGAGIGGAMSATHKRNKGKRLGAGLRGAAAGAGMGALFGSMSQNIKTIAQESKHAPLGAKKVSPFSVKPVKRKAIEVIEQENLGADDLKHLIRSQGKMKNANISLHAFYDELAKIGGA